jgi:hypothetical protein
MTIRHALFVLTGLFATSLGATAPAAAQRVTRGDAEAVFQGAFNGGWAIRLHSDSLKGVPADFLVDSLARITPAADRNGRHYCALDWHVVNVAIVEGNRFGETATNKELLERLANRHVEFNIDGETIDTRRTPPKRTTNPQNRAFVEAFIVSEGQVLAPDAISVGQHLLTATGFRPGAPPMALPTVVFFIDAPGTGVCGPEDALSVRLVK